MSDYFPPMLGEHHLAPIGQVLFRGKFLDEGYVLAVGCLDVDVVLDHVTIFLALVDFRLIS